MFSSSVQLIYYVIIAVVGIIGNTTTIIVFSQRRLRSLRSSFFLTCLAITDLVFILVLIVAWLDEVNISVMAAPTCYLTIYVSHIASFLSSNFTLAYTSHRLIAVFFPIKAATFLKKRTNRIVALILTVFAFLFYSLSFPVTRTELRPNSTYLVNCTETKYPNLLSPFLMLDSAFTFLIPFSLISLMNLAIACRLHSQPKLKISTKTSMKSSPNRSAYPPSVTSTSDFPNSSSVSNVNQRKTSMYSSESVSSICSSSKNAVNRRHYEFRPTANAHSLKLETLKSVRSTPTMKCDPVPTSKIVIAIRSNNSRASASAKTTKMLLAASTAFLVFNLPYHTLLFCFLLIKTQPTWMITAINAARLWFFASFCVNFFVYVICGRYFRKEVTLLFGLSTFRCCSMKRQTEMASSPSENYSLKSNHC